MKPTAKPFAAAAAAGVFDPWSLRFVQNVNFSSNQGSRFPYVQVSTWASVEDFIGKDVAEIDLLAFETNPAAVGHQDRVVAKRVRQILKAAIDPRRTGVEVGGDVHR